MACVSAAYSWKDGYRYHFAIPSFPVLASTTARCSTCKNVSCPGSDRTNDSEDQHLPLSALKVAVPYLSANHNRTAEIPSWLMWAAIPGLRPRQTWSLRRALDVYTLRHWYRVLQKTGPYAHTSNHRALETSKHVLGEWIEPVGKSFIVGEVKKWADVVDVKPIRLPGYWDYEHGSSIDVGARAVRGEKALHGGGYTSLSAHPSGPTSEFAK